MDTVDNFIEFNIDIQEVIGKRVVDNFLNEVVEKCNEFGTYCVIDIIEDDIDSGSMKGGSGGESTFPFNMFERTANKVAKIRETSEKTNIGLFDRLFSFLSPRKDTPEPNIASEATSIEKPVEEPESVVADKKEIDTSYKTKIRDVNEVITVNIKLFDETIEKDVCGGSLYELEYWFSTKKTL